MRSRQTIIRLGAADSHVENPSARPHRAPDPTHNPHTPDDSGRFHYEAPTNRRAPGVSSFEARKRAGVSTGRGVSGAKARVDAATSRTTDGSQRNDIPVPERRNGPGDPNLTPEERMRQQLVLELERGRAGEACRVLAEGVSQGIVPDSLQLARWLVAKIGEAATRKVVSAYAQSPCFSCKNGLEPCESCEGHGHSADGDICERCAGLGAVCCDFCSGSGLLPYDGVPVGLRIPVALMRMKSAKVGIEKLLRRTAPGTSGSEPPSSLRESAKALSGLIRLLGVFENGLLLAKGLSESESKGKAMLAHAVRASVGHASACRSRIRHLLQNMAASARAAAESAHEAHGREMARKRAALYESLLKQPNALVGTGLEHPFLDKAIRKLAGQPSRSGPGATSPAQSVDPNPNKDGQ